MKNPLDSLWGTVISGLVLTLILYNVVRFVVILAGLVPWWPRRKRQPGGSP